MLLFLPVDRVLTSSRLKERVCEVHVCVGLGKGSMQVGKVGAASASDGFRN
jgi:hypothetical protein